MEKKKIGNKFWTIKGNNFPGCGEKITETKSSSINENNLPSPGTTSSPDCNSKENQFFPYVSMESFNETDFEETGKMMSY